MSRALRVQPRVLDVQRRPRREALDQLEVLLREAPARVAERERQGADDALGRLERRDGDVAEIQAPGAARRCSASRAAAPIDSGAMSRRTSHLTRAR